MLRRKKDLFSIAAMIAKQEQKTALMRRKIKYLKIILDITPIFSKESDSTNQYFLLTLHRFFGQHSKVARLRVMAN
jgi:hypothetical protein